MERMKTRKRGKWEKKEREGKGSKGMRKNERKGKGKNEIKGKENGEWGMEDESFKV
jgi:hypothetical protein